MRDPTEQAHCSGLYPPPANVARGFRSVTADWRRRKPLTYLNLFICCLRIVPKKHLQAFSPCQNHGQVLWDVGVPGIVGTGYLFWVSRYVWTSSVFSGQPYRPMYSSVSMTRYFYICDSCS